MIKIKKLPKTIKEMNVNIVDCDDMASVTVYQAKYLKQIKTLAEKHPDEVTIVAGGDGGNDGMLVAHMPKKYCHISFGERQKREMTEEQRDAAKERAKKMQEARREKAEAKKREEEGWL